ncbi:uncharacterized protein ACR2FA_006469 [Aphomia sociella]
MELESRNFAWKEPQIPTSHTINLGLIAGDLKPLGNPLSIKKFLRNSPIFININAKSNPLPLLSLPKLPSKPPPLKLPKPPTTSLLSSAKLRAPIIPPIMPPIIVPPIIPKIPLLPILPIIPPILPPILPLMPPILPILPRFPSLRLSSLLKPLKVPILGKTPLQKALGSEIHPVTIPCPIFSKRKDNIMDKLLKLKNSGALTTAEYIRFKKILLRK